MAKVSALSDMFSSERVLGYHVYAELEAMASLWHIYRSGTLVLYMVCCTPLSPLLL